MGISNEIVSQQVLAKGSGDTHAFITLGNGLFEIQHATVFVDRNLTTIPSYGLIAIEKVLGDSTIEYHRIAFGYVQLIHAVDLLYPRLVQGPCRIYAEVYFDSHVGELTFQISYRRVA